MPVNWGRARVLTEVMLENPDEAGQTMFCCSFWPNNSIVHDIFEAAEYRRMREDKLSLLFHCGLLSSERPL
ncbi:Uncharacterised protein [Salmonella enterica subsp. diarizonae]|nr:Uncharacterised protein [Salmonella enterica subsp. diarizonae]